MHQKRELFMALTNAGPVSLWEKELSAFGKERNTPFLSRQLLQLKERGEKYLKTPAPTLPYSLFRLYWEDGSRIHYERNYFERRGRLLVFSLLSLLYPDDSRYLTALNDIIWDICSEAFWCVPAHFIDEREEGIPFEQYALQLDLFSCETASALAETLFFLKDRLDENVVKQARCQVFKRTLDPFLDESRLFRFEVMSNNWCSVCAGALGIAAIYLMEDSRQLSGFLHRTLSCLQVYLDSFGEDGVCVEGIGYWTYGVGFLTCFSDLLEKRTCGRLSLFSLPKFEAIAKTQQLAFVCGSQTIPFADAHETEGFRIGISSRLKTRYPDMELPALSLAHDILDDTCYRFCFALRDLLWYSSDISCGIHSPLSCYLPDAQWFISRTGSSVLLAKAGNNGESHNHNDCGSFVFYKNGLPLLYDLGAGQYNAQYFSPERYTLFIPSSRSHNVPIIGDTLQSFGAQYAADHPAASFNSDENIFEMELSHCYPESRLSSFTRTFVHIKRNESLLMKDHFTFLTPSHVTEVFVSRSPIRIIEEKALFSTDGTSVILDFSGQGLIASIQEETYMAHHDLPCHVFLLHLTCAEAFNDKEFIIHIS